jgi:hypothetical protein
MIVGFTGTKKGMSDNQKTQLKWLLHNLWRIKEWHHGDCVGADKESDTIVDRHSAAEIQRHPAGAAPLQRNRRLVAAVELLVAAPRTDKEVLRSGTWATIRYARSKGIPIIMLPRGARQ